MKSSKFYLAISTLIFVGACARQPLCVGSLPESLRSDVKFSALASFEERTLVTPNADSADLFKYNRCLARKGDVDAQYRTALAYENGSGTDENIDSAVWWYSRAAKGNSGIIVRERFATSPAVFPDQIIQGVGAKQEPSVEAQYRLGLLYINELSDYRRAKRYLAKAAKAGHEKAQAELDKLQS